MCRSYEPMFFSLSEALTSDLIASEREGKPGCFARQASMAAISAGDMTSWTRFVFSSASDIATFSHKQYISKIHNLCKLCNLCILYLLKSEIVEKMRKAIPSFELLNQVSDSATQVEAIARALSHVPSVSKPPLSDLADALAIQSEALRGLVDTLAIEHGDSAERSLPIFLEQLQLTREAALALNDPVKGIAYTLTTLTISLLDNIKNDLDLQQLELD